MVEGFWYPKNMHGFRFHGRLLPVWVVAVQWRRYCLLELRPVHRPYSQSWLLRQEMRIESYLRTGSVAAAAREVLREQAKKVYPVTRTPQGEGAAIKRAVGSMLEQMRLRDHNADWI